MKKLIQKMTEIERGNTQLNESIASECGDMPMPSYPAADQGNPVTASITLNASGMSHVADLMRLLQQAGLEKAGPPPAPVLPMRTDMENLRDKMVGLEMPPSEPKPQYLDVDDVTAGGDDIHSKKEPEDIRIKDSSLADDVRDTDLEEWDNEPEEEYGDHLDMIKRLAGGINREKTQYRAAQPGDNAMAVESDDEEIDMSFVKPFRNKKTGQMHWQARNKEGTLQIFNNEEEAIEFSQSGDAELAASDRRIFGYESKVKESIKDRLYRALSEKKAKPDFLDLDGAGNTEEPMRKAAKKKKSSVKEAEYQAPTHELDDTARKAMTVAQKIKRKINSGEPMDDRDYNQMAELGAILSKFGTNFGPKSMKDVMAHMVQYTDDRNQEGHGYLEFNAERFKELIAMAKSTAESAVNEISPDLAKRYTKAAKMDRDFSDDSLERLSRIQRYGSDSDSRQAGDDMAKIQRRNAKRQRGINRAAKRM